MKFHWDFRQTFNIWPVYCFVFPYVSLVSGLDSDKASSEACRIEKVD
jgi:hypothetical protein